MSVDRSSCSNGDRLWFRLLEIGVAALPCFLLLLGIGVGSAHGGVDFTETDLPKVVEMPAPSIRPKFVGPPPEGDNVLLTGLKTVGISDATVAKWIDEYVPAESNRLIVMSQCYGGSALDKFTGKANTTVISATSPGQTAAYGGYHDDAAMALRPGVGRTALTVHNAGIAGKYATETPSTGGGKAPADFSLVDTAAAGDVRSRHVLIYAGMPGKLRYSDPPKYADSFDRDAIKANFDQKLNTTVKSVGGNGTNGWDAPSTPKDLLESIKAIGEQISAGINPAANEQFILFIGDHGGLARQGKIVEAQNVPDDFTIRGIHSLETTDFDTNDLMADPDAVPGFSFFIDLYASGISYEPRVSTLFSPGNWSMSLHTTGGVDTTLTDFEEQPWELADASLSSPDVVGDSPGEGVNIFFSLSKGQFVSQFLDATYDMHVFNNSGVGAYIPTLISQTTGGLDRAVPVPEPGIAGTLVAASLALMQFRRRRSHHPKATEVESAHLSIPSNGHQSHQGIRLMARPTRAENSTPGSV